MSQYPDNFLGLHHVWAGSAVSSAPLSSRTQPPERQNLTPVLSAPVSAQPPEYENLTSVWADIPEEGIHPRMPPSTKTPVRITHDADKAPALWFVSAPGYPQRIGIELEMTLRINVPRIQKLFPELGNWLASHEVAAASASASAADDNDDDGTTGHTDDSTNTVKSDGWPRLRYTIISLMLDLLPVNKHRESPSAWSVAQDLSLRPRRGYEGVEFISPIFASPEEADIHLKQLWDLVLRYFIIDESRSCGTHIHVSPGGRPWVEAELLPLAKGVLYYDPVIAGLVPESRRKNKFCRSNVHSASVKNLLFKEADALPKTKSVPEAESEAPEAKKTATLYGPLYDEAFEGIEKALEAGRSSADEPFQPFVDFMGIEKFQSFNFKNLQGPNRLDTVEFRRPPMSMTWEDAMAWVYFILAFVNACLIKDWLPVQSSQGFPSVEDLWLLLKNHILANPSLRLSLDSVESLFSDKVFVVDMIFDAPWPLDVAQKYELLEKARRPDFEPKKMEELIDLFQGLTTKTDPLS